VALVRTPGAGTVAEGSVAAPAPGERAGGAGQAASTGVAGAPAQNLAAPLAAAVVSPVPDAPVGDRPSISAVVGRGGSANLVPLPSPVEAAIGVRLPRDRVVAYYGNPIEPAMGILGLAPSSAMLDKLHQQMAAYGAADRRRPVRAALELVTPAAQKSPGEDGLYRARMSPALIERVAAWAEADHDLLILDVQLGRSSVSDELAALLPYLRRPYVHLALDPEFAMGAHQVPGRVIGSLDADQINEAIDTLNDLVGTDRLPPKLLIVHRFTEQMVTHTDRIAPKPSVQVVMTMDGFGAPSLKEDSYRAYVRDQKVEFAGVKLFYDQDKPLLSPEETLALDPTPDVVIYQ
jgi:hypothetical protein